MIEMSPFYAHDSSVGPVFDAATWSPGRSLWMGIVAFGFGVVITVAIIAAWTPTLLVDKPPQVLTDFHDETLKLAGEHPWIAYGGSVLAGLFALVVLAASCACAMDAASGDYYLRVGPGGISLRVPHGLDPARLFLASAKREADIPMDELDDWTIVQNKQLVSLSRNAGNVSAFLQIKVRDGRRHYISLDCFREPARVIRSKINDALEMVPAGFSLQEPVEAPAGVTNAGRNRQRHAGFLEGRPAGGGRSYRETLRRAPSVCSLAAPSWRTLTTAFGLRRLQGTDFGRWPFPPVVLEHETKW